ncbi:MAG: S9 family peptidase [Neisseriaceae bacterium]|nr:S9 family peptidase [Neisseriaceae bacterium]
MLTPYRPDLETFSEETQLLAEKASQCTEILLCQNPEFYALQQEIRQSLSDPTHIPVCEEHNDVMYHFLQDEHYPKGVYRACDAQYYRAALPNWQILFSVADFDEILGEDVYLTGISHCETCPTQALLFLSPQGSDAAFVLEFDLATKKIVENGFHFPCGKNHIAWRDKDSLWVCPAFDERHLTHSGYPREVWLFNRGDSFETATPVFQAASDVVSVEAWRYLDTQGKDLDMICVNHGFFTPEYFVVDKNNQPTALPLPDGAQLCGVLGGFLLLRLQKAWQRTKQTHKAGSLIAVKFAKGQLLEAFILFNPAEKQSLQCVETSRHCVLIHYLDNVSASLKAWKLNEGGAWREIVAPQIHAKTLELTDQPLGGDVFYFLAEDTVNPPVLYLWDAGCDELSVIRRRKAVFDIENLQLKQDIAISQDGTEVPYFWCGQNENPNTPTIVLVYGGFGENTLPTYQEILGKHWLAKGGAIVFACVRGGGELGVDWHNAAQRQNKYKAVEDLIAVVNDIQRKNRTNPDHTVLQGGSNGALIAMSAVCKIPQQIATLVAEVPIADMLHYTQFGAGASWIDEYGDPNHTDFQAALHRLSPIVQLDSVNGKLPAILITADLTDDRVTPIHALKLYAKLTDKNANALLYLNESGGHDGNTSIKQTAKNTAVVIQFLHQQFGL